MLTTAQLLEPLARHRTNEVVVTTMSVVRPWGRLSDHPLDFASADSAMGHAADLALGIALARPERNVICLNGDGSMLMCLGTLATAVGAAAHNFILFVADNGEYEITGNQPVPGAGRVDHAGLARAAGFPEVFRFEDARAYAEALPTVLSRSGPTFVHVVVEPGSQGPIGRSDAEEARYLRTSLAESARAVRAALAADAP
jgi:thiamine pyrophosphate-dependent acetolactate synthase large subunit-like protein